MKIISTGFARCASMALTRFVAGLGFHSFHEPCSYVKNIDHWLNRPAYDVKQYPLDFPPSSVVEFCNLWPRGREIRMHDEYFAADWSLGLVMYELQKRQPDITWIITLRDPIIQINSLLAYRNDTRMELFLDKWIEYHLFLLKQLQRMERRPYLLEFDSLVHGQYDAWLRDLCGSQGMISNFWEKKINTAGVYEKQPIGTFGIVCDAIQDAIYEECEVV